jgi:hypothetical protein
LQQILTVNQEQISGQDPKQIIMLLLFSEPQSGEYPLILGDQAVFFLINDARGQHTESGGPKLNIEVYGMLYAYDGSSNSDLDNTIFLNYTIKNRSAYNYSNVKAGMWIDFDMGCSLGDYSGSDSVLNSFYAYSDKTFDSDCSTLGYHNNLPSQGVVFLNQSLTSYMTFNNDFTLIGNPENYYHFNNYMSAKWKDGSPAKDTCGFNVGSVSPYTDFMNHDDPNDVNGISDYTCVNSFGIADRRHIGTAGNLSLPAGGKLCIDIAFPVAFDSSAVNPHLKSVTKLKQRIQNIQNYYDQGLIGCPALALGVDEKVKSKNVSLKIYPNPASQMMNIQTENVQSSIKAVMMFDITGKAVCAGDCHASLRSARNDGHDTPNIRTIDVSGLTNGLYFLHVEMSNGERVVRKVIKE